MSLEEYRDEQVWVDGMLHKIGVKDRVFYFSGTGWQQSSKDPETIIKAVKAKRNPEPPKKLKKTGPKPKNKKVA